MLSRILPVRSSRQFWLLRSGCWLLPGLRRLLRRRRVAAFTLAEPGTSAVGRVWAFRHVRRFCRPGVLLVRMGRAFIRWDLDHVVLAFGRARFTFFADGCFLAGRFSGLGRAWDLIRFGGRPAAPLWGGPGVGDTTATLRHSMGIVSRVMLGRKFTKVLCTFMAVTNEISFGYIAKTARHTALPTTGW